MFSLWVPRPSLSSRHPLVSSIPGFEVLVLGGGGHPSPEVGWLNTSPWFPFSLHLFMCLTRVRWGPLTSRRLIKARSPPVARETQHSTNTEHNLRSCSFSQTLLVRQIEAGFHFAAWKNAVLKKYPARGARVRIFLRLLLVKTHTPEAGKENHRLRPVAFAAVMPHQHLAQG